ncbi:mandelate racemase/muconate lactonizing enzyme family protein [uncultured Alsobacter sp.]|uniref:mandelate racemase/muconate lactonizing enzyme family protein n=1 Tax=uncultured Alsobacter sp. TaxID=1748258 RepID=UPI0025F88A3F|nr:mandelate racemase/muconate lactonizing enzyme family protein [uncultured Alsobacter sp.]
MRVTAIETIRTDAHDNLIWVRIETDTGHAGLGETFFAPGTVEAHIHEDIARRLLGGDATRIEHWHRTFMRHPVGYASSGAEVRAASAIDIALWDLMGRATGLPLWRLLGGLVRDEIRVYNTCAGPHYATKARGEVKRWFGIDHDTTEDLDDLKGFMHEPVALARSLLAEGITGMKIWPFDFAAFANGGTAITPAQIEEGVRPFRLIREACGDAMDLMVELHGLWDLESARRIVAAVEPYRPAWIEDPIPMHDAEGLAAMSRFTRIPIYGSETTSSKESFRRLLEQRSVSIVSFDVGWSGGITEGRKIAALADAWQVPIAPHDCTGPVGYVAGSCIALTSPNALIQETVRAYTRGWYAAIATALPPIVDGRLRPLPGPGLGFDLSPAFLADPGTRRRRSALS